MLIAVDVYYNKESANVAGVMFTDWEDKSPLYEKKIEIPLTAEYIPGSFYLRELPCILELLKNIIIYPDVIIIDGYALLGKGQKPGLGFHLYKSLNGEIPVIGVAKTAYQDTPENSQLFRGKSKRPLFITGAGIDPGMAKNYINKMYGQHRIPHLLKRVDQLSRQT